MGRKTYQVAASQGRAGSKNAKKKTGRAGKVAMRSYVFSRTLQAIDDPSVELVAGDAVGFVGDLKRRPGKGICLMGAGELAQCVFGTCLVYRIGLIRHPACFSP